MGGFSSGNDVSIFHDGDLAFAAIFKAIQSAKRSIFVETYIIANDMLGIAIRDALVKAKARGVDVTLIYDHFGSARLTYNFIKPMADAQIKLLPFNPIWPWRRHGPLLFRDHRKIIVVDKAIAFCGGMNITADYAGPIYGNGRYRDTIAMLKGPAVKDLLAITKETIAESEFNKNPNAFNQQLELTVNKRKAVKLFFSRIFRKDITLPKPNEEETLVQVLGSNVRRNLAHIQRSLEESVNRAQDYCYFTTPYFMPHKGLRKAMINAKKRGVDVQVLTAGISDVPLMRYAARHVFLGFIKSDIRIYEMTKRTLHAKIVTIDGVYSSVGSYNLDHWSARRNLEVNVSFIDKQTAISLKEQFNKDLKLSQEIHKSSFLNRSIFKRILCLLAYIFYRL